MAEDGQDFDASLTDGSRPQSASSRARKTQKSKSRPQSTHGKTKCRSRIDQLAIPSRRLILALYQDHADHLPREKVEKIKALLQELYAMTPEETEKYFQHLREQANEIRRRKDIKYMLKRLVRRKKKAKQIRKAYEFVNRLLIKSMEYAVNHPIPPLVSVRLRNLSNIILEQISDMKNVKVPNRDQPDPVEYFLIQVADWMAIAIEHLYYGVQLKKNQELQKLTDEASAREKLNKQKGEAAKDIAEGAGEVEGEEEDDASEAVISEPLLVSEME